MYEVYEIVGIHGFFNLDSIYLVCSMEYKDESLTNGDLCYFQWQLTGSAMN